MIAAAVASVAAVACTGTPDERRAGERPAPERRRGGRLVFGVVGAPAALDPYSRRASDLTRWLARPLYPSLFRLLPDGTPQPYLARSIEQLPSGSRVVLRRARWSDGRPITATDVVASARRARPPSGFAAFRDVRRSGPRGVVFEGKVASLRRALASAAFVLPRGKAGGATGGPYELRSYRPGLEVVLQRNRRWTGAGPLLDRVRVRFVESLRLLLELLERRRLEAAAPPSLVNLRDVVGSGVSLEGRLGWETVVVDFRGSPLDQGERAAVADAIDVEELEEAFVRDAGEIVAGRPSSTQLGAAEGLAPMPPDRRVSIGVPSGDELLELMQEAIFRQLASSGVDADLVAVDQTTLYGRWAQRSPLDATLKRAVVPPSGGLFGSDRGIGVYPLFRVASFVAARRGVRGLAPNPTLEGPLWNVERWSVDG